MLVWRRWILWNKKVSSINFISQANSQFLLMENSSILGEVSFFLINLLIQLIGMTLFDNYD